MKLKINEFSILSPSNMTAFSENFQTGINLIVGKKDTGKTTLARSILYTLGCDVKGFDLINSSPENIYIMNFNIDNTNYILIRQRLGKGRGKNCFKIFDQAGNQFVYYDTTSFKEKLNELLDIQLVTLNKDGEATKLYPNHIFLPFYTDQDYSWQTYLKDTFNGINFIPDNKKLILEYITGARSKSYYNLKLEKSLLKREFQNYDALIKSKELIIEENLRNIKILEDIDINNFKKNYETVLELYNSIIETEHYLKEQLNERIYEKNTLIEMQDSITSSIDSMIEGNLQRECPTCKQSIINEMEENYKYLVAKQNLIKEREKIKMQLQDVQADIDRFVEELNDTITKSSGYEDKLNADATVVSMLDRADSYALSRINIRIEQELKELKTKRTDCHLSLEEIEEALNKLNNKDVATDYKQLMISAFDELSIKFSYNNYYTSNLESVNIALSGASKVQAYIAQYISIYLMSSGNKEVIDIPMFIDTFLKDDFNDTEIQKTASYIFSKLEDLHQSFIFISDNNQTLSAIESYNFNRIDLTETFNLFNKDYNEVYERYKLNFK